jgi:hypothetical protein
MTNEIDQLREQYAQAYSDALPSDEPARRQPDEAIHDYTSLWCSAYAPDLIKVVERAEKALAHLDQGRSATQAQNLTGLDIYSDGGTGVEQLLLEAIPPLRTTLLTERMDDAAYRRALELIVRAFGSAQSQ